jgi:PAS domain S-box-containing protein
MRSTFEMAAVGMAHLDAGGRFLRANSELLKSFDIAEAELLQSTLFDLTHPDDRVALHTRFDQLVRGHCDRLTLEMRGIRSAQAELWLSVSAAPVAGPDGAVDFIVAVIENITARRQGAAAIVAAEAAHRANAAKSRFLSHMSHELRTPLNSVVGFSQLLQMDTGTPLSNAQRSHARQIEAAGSHLLSMINDLLDLSRIESGTVSMSIEPLDLREPIDEAVSLVSKAAADAGLRVLLQWPALGGLTRVAADRVRLRQVLVNLLSNAIKYNRRGGSITVEVAVGPEAGRVAIHIRDTGQGMSAEQLGHLFEPFNRLGAERTQIEGTGIGLLITRNLVELMGGELRVQSELGMGSCFSVLLPLPIEQARLHAGQAADSSASSLTEAPDVRLTMLYAEDNPTNVMLMQALMEMRPQWRLVVAESGHAALAIAAHEHFDLLLLDMNLGDMTGLDLLWQLRSNPQLVAVPCMMLTADALPATQKLAAQAGVMNYLTKPIDVPIFLAAIDAVAQRR